MKPMKIVGGRTGRIWPAVVRAVRNSRFSARRVILYVPEQMTLQTERNLITDLKLKGLLDIEVISPKKLRLLVKEKAGGSNKRTLGEAGQVMAVHRAMTETAADLGFYRDMTELPGAVERIREALFELEESGITPEETEGYAAGAAAGAARAKLRDLNRIRGAWETLVTEHFDGEKAAWTDTVRRLGDTDLLQGADLMVYGFDTIRPDLRELLVRAWSLAADTWVFLETDRAAVPDGNIYSEVRRSVQALEEALTAAGGTCRTAQVKRPRTDWNEPMEWMDRQLFSEAMAPYPGTLGDEITLYAAADRTDEAEQAAECLLKWRREGIPWERMAVALPKGSGLEGVFRSRLRLSGIPFYSAEKTPAAAHGVCRMLLSALECISEGYSLELAAEMAGSGFTALTEEEASLLTVYAEAHGIEGSRWRKPFTTGEDAAEAERIRRKLLDPVEDLREAMKDAGSASASVEAVVRFLEAEGVWNRLRAREETLLENGLYSQAVTDARVWKLLTELLDQLWTLLGQRRCSLREMHQMLESALNNASLSGLPETEIGVVMGEVGHLQAGEIDTLILPGCQEGILSAPDSGWLSDREREDLQAGTGREVGVTRERRGVRRKYDYHRTLLAPAKKVRVSWSLRDEGGSPLQEDSLVSRIRTIFPGVRESGGVRGTREDLTPRTPLKAMESAGTVADERAEGIAPAAAEQALIALLRRGGMGRTMRAMLEELRAEAEQPALAPETAGRLFRTDTVSISRLERYASCPYRHFIDYGLRPVEQESYEFDSADAGNFFHAALDRFMKTAEREQDWPALSDERVDGMMDAICAELTEEWEGGPLREDPLGIWQGEDTLRRTRHAARVLTRFAANSDFRTIATEQSFGKGGSLPPMTLRLADGSSVTLQGIIDRIDTYENGEGVWLRVVDNKSSGKKPEAPKMADGEQLQLMIYLKAAVAAYPQARPAGAMFFPVQDAEVSGAEESPEAIEAERLKKVRMKGLVNAREDVVRAMDRDVKPYSLDEVFNKDGSVRKNAEWAVEESVLTGLMDAAEAKAADICGEIRQGRIDVRPRGKGEEDAPCRFCGYRTLCHRRRESLVSRDEGITFRDVAGKNLRDAEK